MVLNMGSHNTGLQWVPNLGQQIIDETNAFLLWALTAERRIPRIPRGRPAKEGSLPFPDGRRPTVPVCVGGSGR